MAGPWEQYQSAAADGPWTNYADTSPKVTGEPVSRLSKIARGMKDPFDAAAQMFEKVMPDGFNSANRSVNNWIADKTGMLSSLPENGVDGLIAQQEKDYQAKRASAGESGFDGYRVIGNVASPANLALASKIPQGVGLAAKVGYGAMGGAASGALSPVFEGDFWQEKAKQAGIGAAMGGAVPAVMGGVSRIISPNASTNPALATLKNEGVKPTIGQSLGGWANTVEEKAQSLPILGDAISSARSTAREQFNNAAINRATAPIGIKAQGSGTQAIEDAGNAISAVYDQAKAAMGGFRIDAQANSELSNLRMMATRGLEGKERNAVNRYFADYLKKPGLTSESFKELDSKLTSDIAKFGTGDAYQQKVSDALKEVQRVITENAKRANPEAAALFKQADEAWANLVRVEGASVGAKATDGVFTPGQLLTAVRGADRSVRDRSTARGTALMQDLASAGQSVLGNKVPNSGTADRLMLGGAGLGAYFVNPAIPAGLVGGAAMYASPVQNLLRNLVSTRPQFAQPISDSVRQISPFLVPGSAQVGLGLLN